jgi:hypothetical protein
LERWAVTGWGEGLGGLTGSAGTLVLLFNGIAVGGDAGIATTQAVGEGWLVKRNG